MLSDSDVNQDYFLDVLLEAGASVYVAVSAEDSPRLQIDPQRLQLIAPYVIQAMTTPRQPLPEYKDLLVPRGMLYQAHDAPLDLSVARVPNGQATYAAFAGGLSLVGFDVHPTQVEQGESFRATYYWELAEQINTDYWVDVLFTDADGNVATRAGFPLWLHSHWIGGRAQPTSTWNGETTYRQVLDGLVPRDIPPGVYQIRAYLYQGIREKPVEALNIPSPADGILLGTIQVSDP